MAILQWTNESTMLINEAGGKRGTVNVCERIPVDLSGDTATILNFIFWSNYYGMLYYVFAHYKASHNSYLK